jgi:hypothetical protein
LDTWGEVYTLDVDLVDIGGEADAILLIFKGVLVKDVGTVSLIWARAAAFLIWSRAAERARL